MSIDYARLTLLQQQIKVAEAELRAELYGRKVRFKAWLMGGKQRTGTINYVYSGRKSVGITIGVAVDRIDGPDGTLVDTWYGDLSAVEVLDEV